jgi:tetratricopeptide (TPR) repeat protein
VGRNFRVICAGIILAALPILTAAWPHGWPDWPLQLIQFVLTFLGCVLVEMERRSHLAMVAQARRQQPPGAAGYPMLRQPPTLVPAPPPRQWWWARRRRRGTAQVRAGRRWWGIGPRRPVVPDPIGPLASDTLPTQAIFRGRDRDLRELLRRHQTARAQADLHPDASVGPVLLLIHGKPGVGKSVLAQELARNLTDRYRDGRYYTNLGNAGDPLSPGEVLKRLLDALRWPDPIPDETIERARIFRALTINRRMLFVFDAARDHQQVLDVLPSGPGCAVIVTSRRDLGPNLGTHSWPLDIPDIDEALDILHAIAGTDEYDAPECAAEVVELCGRLPVAIQSAGERISQEFAILCNVAQMLREKPTRLERLTRRGRDFAEGIATEYRQLNLVEQQAFCLLTTVESPAFVPWVLCPLLGVRLGEAENLVTRLSGAQLVDVVEQDESSGVARYRLHPLVRLFAEEQIRLDPDLTALRDQARSRLHLGYRGVVIKVLRELEPEFTPDPSPVDGRWLPDEFTLPAAIARQPQGWIRAEYRDLVRCSVNAYANQEWGLCWRVAAWLGDCLPDGSTGGDLLPMFDNALRSAEHDANPLGHIDVLLARGACLTAIERYAEAQRSLAQAIEEATALAEQWTAEGGSDWPALRRRASAHLYLGEGYLQMRAARRSEEELQIAHQLFERLGLVDEVQLVRLLDNLNFDFVPRISRQELQALTRDSHRYWALLELAEEQRRGHEWEAAARYLNDAARRYQGDSRRTASIQYRLGRLYLEQALSATEEPDGPPLSGDDAVQRQIQRAVRRATDVVLRFHRMENPVGEIRARCLLVRALAAANRLADAEQQMHVAFQRLADLDGQDLGGAREPLEARLYWAQGVLGLRRADNADDLDEARGVLIRAAGIFDDLADGRSRAAVMRLIRQVDRAGLVGGHRPGGRG